MNEELYAHLYTDLPKKTGERNLAKQLKMFKDAKLHLWFGLDFVPGVKDNDILIWHEEAGVFVVEVKAVTIEMIEFYGWDKSQIKGRKEDDTPARQANWAMHSLWNFLAPKMDKAPFMKSTVCWPLISRDIWNRWWDEPRVVGEYAKRMIFREDIESGVSTLKDRLKYIWQNPPVKEGARYPYRHDDKTKKILADVTNALYVKAKPSAAPSDLEKLRIIEDSVTRETLNEALQGSGKHIFYYGYPGTGKTFRLLQLGVAHALAGYRVLFACFNKVLAADIRRMLSYSEKLSQSEGSLLVQDVFAIASDYAIRKPLQDYDKWGEAVLAEMKTIADDLPKYETILIDEAQDMKDWALEMIDIFSAPNTTFCVAGGDGQNLYGESSKWLLNFTKAARQRRLNRNFRNTAPVARLAHVFYEAALDKNKIPNVKKKFISKSKKGSEQMLLFERPDGIPPSILYIDESLSAPSDNEVGISEAQYKDIVEEYKRIIKMQLDQLLPEERYLDLLILVPKPKSLERRCALEAIEKLQVSYIDYTEEEHRRYIAQPDMIRLCTFHSARGIEGRRVIILGVEHLESLSQEINISFNNLGYIALSRAIFECVIGFRQTIESQVYNFIEDAIYELRNN